MSVNVEGMCSDQVGQCVFEYGESLFRRGGWVNGSEDVVGGCVLREGGQVREYKNYVGLESRWIIMCELRCGCFVSRCVNR